MMTRIGDYFASLRGLARNGLRRSAQLQELVRGASVAGLLKALAAVLAFGLSVVLGRVLGADGAGLYFLSLTVVTIAATIGRLGLDSAVLRFVAAYASTGNWTAVRSVFRSSVGITVIGSCSIAAPLFLAADFLAVNVFTDPYLAAPIRLMSAAVVPLSLGVLVSQALLGLSRVRDSILVFSIFPAGMGFAGTWILAPTWQVSGAIIAYVVGVAAALVYGWASWRRALQGRFDEAVAAPRAQEPTRALLNSGLPLLIGALLQLVIQASGTFMLGIWSETAEVSEFAVALRTAALISFPLLAVKAIAQPKFAELYANGDAEGLAATAHKSTLLLVVCGAPVFLVFMLAPVLVMSAFGSEFSDGALTLQILSMGQFINVVAGAVGVLLVMSGHEREFRNSQIATAAVALLFNCLLIPAYGAVGAAIAATAALIVQNALFSYCVWKRLHIVMFVKVRRHAVGS